MAHRRKSPVWAIFLHLKHKPAYQATLGTQEPTPIRSTLVLVHQLTLHGPIIGPYHSLTFCRLGVHPLHYTFPWPLIDNKFLDTIMYTMDPQEH